MRTSRTSVLLLAAAASFVACGSDPAPQPAPMTDSDATRTELLEHCRGYAERLCASAGPCCETRAPFDPEHCVEEFVRDVCGPRASAVAEGHASYDESAEEACLSANARAFATCVADWDELLAIRRDVWSACQIVQGKREPGQGCGTAAMCVRPPGANVLCAENVCQVQAILGEGAECPYPNGDVSVCDAGLYCTAIAADELGTCVPAVPLGDACDPTNLQNPECGLGNYCDRAEGVCKKAVNFGGLSCEQGTECVSFQCDRTARSCDEPPLLPGDLCATN